MQTLLPHAEKIAALLKRRGESIAVATMAAAEPRRMTRSVTPMSNGTRFARYDHATRAHASSVSTSIGV